MNWNMKNDRYTILLSLYLMVLVVFLGRWMNPDIGAIVFFIGLTITIINKSNMGNSLKRGLILNFLICIGYAYYVYSNDIINFTDTLGYLDILDLMIKSKNNTLEYVINYAGTLHVGYHYLNYFIFNIFKSKFALYLINISMALFSIIFFYNHISTRFKDTIAKATTFFLIISIYLKIYTSNILKDSLILFLAMISIYLYDKYMETKRLTNIIMLFMMLIFLVMTRIYSGIGISLGLLMDYIILNKDMFKYREVFKDKRLYMFIILIVLLAVFSPLNLYVKIVLGFISDINISFNSIITIIKSMITFFLSPLVWNMLGELTIYTPIVVDSFFFLIFSPILIRVLYKLIINQKYRKMMYIYIIPSLIHIMALGIAYGKTPSRQKIAVYPFIVLIYMIELTEIWNIMKARKNGNKNI